MFCKKCGNEISPSEKFCSKCGTPVAGAAPSQPHASAQPKQLSISVPNQVKNPLGIMYLIVAAMHLFQLAFWTIKTFKYYSEGDAVFSTSDVISGEEKAFATFFMVILAVVAINLCVMPILMNSVNKARKMIAPLLSSVWTLGWFIYAWSNDVIDGLSFCGWLLFFSIIISLLVEVVILLVSNKIIALAK